MAPVDGDISSGEVLRVLRLEQIELALLFFPSSVLSISSNG